MRFLSTRRRHRFAGVVVLGLGLLLAGTAFTALAPDSATAETDQTRLVEDGRELFLVGCASCHGTNAEGILTKRDGNYGPSLIGVGSAAVDFQMRTGRMPMAQVSNQAHRKESEYTEDQIQAISAFVASLAPGPSVPDAEWYDTTDLTAEEVAEGGEFFRTNCTACHNSVGAGGALPSGRYAPTLHGVDARDVYTAMLTGPQQMPKFSDQVLTPEQKRNIIGYIQAMEAEPSYGGWGNDVGPSGDGVVVWTVGIGGLIGIAVWIAAHGARAKKA